MDKKVNNTNEDVNNTNKEVDNINKDVNNTNEKTESYRKLTRAISIAAENKEKEEANTKNVTESLKEMTSKALDEMSEQTKKHMMHGEEIKDYDCDEEIVDDVIQEIEDEDNEKLKLDKELRDEALREQEEQNKAEDSKQSLGKTTTSVINDADDITLEEIFDDIDNQLEADEAEDEQNAKVGYSKTSSLTATTLLVAFFLLLLATLLGLYNKYTKDFNEIRNITDLDKVATASGDASEQEEFRTQKSSSVDTMLDVTNINNEELQVYVDTLAVQCDKDEYLEADDLTWVTDMKTFGQVPVLDTLMIKGGQYGYVKYTNYDKSDNKELLFASSKPLDLDTTGLKKQTARYCDLITDRKAHSYITSYKGTFVMMNEALEDTAKADTETKENISDSKSQTENEAELNEENKCSVEGVEKAQGGNEASKEAQTIQAKLNYKTLRNVYRNFETNYFKSSKYSGIKLRFAEDMIVNLSSIFDGNKVSVMYTAEDKVLRIKESDNTSIKEKSIMIYAITNEKMGYDLSNFLESTVDGIYLYSKNDDNNIVMITRINGQMYELKFSDYETADSFLEQIGYNVVTSMLRIKTVQDFIKTE